VTERVYMDSIIIDGERYMQSELAKIRRMSGASL